MKLLLDTHVFLWSTSSPRKLSSAAAAALTHPSNERLLSVITPWEIVIKSQIRRLTLHQPIDPIIAAQLANGLSLLPVRYEHVIALRSLALIHRDPFDRMLAAQAIAEGAVLVTADRIFAKYPIQTLW